MSPQQFSHDQAVKNLIKRYPVEALEFLAEDVIAAHGVPSGVEFLDSSVSKDDTAEPGPGQAMDLAIRYTFADDRGVLFVLVEHWSSADKLDLMRTARYYLDLCRRFPSDEILPIALVDDERPRELVDQFQRGASGEVFLSFRTRIVQVPALELSRYRHSRNRVALSFSPNMRGAGNAVDQVLRVAQEFYRQQDEAGFKTFFAFWVVEGRLRVEDQNELNRRMKEMDRPIIMDWLFEEGHEKGVEQGAKAARLADARKMREHGIALDVILDITGVTEAELKAID